MTTLRIVALAIVSILVMGLFTAMGVYGNAPWSGCIVGAMIAVAIVAVVWNNPLATVWANPNVQPVVKWTAIVLLFITVPFLVIGMWSPRLNTGLDRLAENNKQAVANYVDKKSLKSERESGTFGVVSGRVGVYDENGTVVTVNGVEALIREGVRVKAADLKGKPASGRLEGMTRIILPNSHGDFVDGNIVYIPSQKINWSGA